MAVIDENSVNLGVPTSQLMENAGAEVTRTILDSYGAKGEKILIVAGTGNNGGDGFVVARHLANLGAVVSVVLLGKSHDIRTTDARMNWDNLTKMAEGVKLKNVANTSHLEILEEEINSAHLLIDAILGTGLQGPLRDPIATAVKMLNESNRPILAIDTPTGLNPSSGEVHGIAIHAQMTVTFHRMKRGLIGKEEYTGKVIIRDIGIPLEAELFTGPGDVRRVTKPRDPYSHKGDHGYVLVVGGSAVYSGAPALAGLAALRTGAGLAILTVPKSVALAVKAYSPDLIVHSLSSDVVNPKDVPLIETLLQRMDALIIGPGIGLASETQQAIHEILSIAQKLSKPILIDADGIKALKENLSLIRESGIILTPHAGEFKIITGLQTKPRWQDRFQPALKFAKTNECILLLKGHETIITNGVRFKVNKTGNPGMATGGTGDVLSGIIGTYLAQYQAPFEAAVAGAWVHGSTGDLAFQEKGYHLVASDLIDKIPDVLKPFDR